MRKMQANLTVVKGPVYAFDRRMRVGESIRRTVTKFDDSEMVKGKDGKLSNPKGFEGMEVGYRDVPCVGCFRIEEVSTDPTVRQVPLQDRIIEALQKLDHDDPTQWTSKGEPLVAAVETLVGAPLTADEIFEALPNFVRRKGGEDDL